MRCDPRATGRVTVVSKSETAVRATVTGFYGGTRRRPGAVFNLSAEDARGRWMERTTVPDVPATNKTERAPAAGASRN